MGLGIPRLTLNFDPTFNFVGTTYSELFGRRSFFVGVIQSSDTKFRDKFRVRVGLNRRSFDRRTLLDVASVVPSGLKRRSRFPVLDVFWT